MARGPHESLRGAVGTPGDGSGQHSLRILFIHEVNYLRKVIYEMQEFPELLAARGHEVAFLHYPEGGQPGQSRRLAPRTVEEDVAGRAHPDQTVRLITPPNAGGSNLERYLAPLVSLPALARSIDPGRFDVVVSYSVPTTGWQSAAMARRRGVPFVFRSIDISHSLRPTKVGALIKRSERFIYPRADLVSCNNPAIADYCIEHGADPSAIRLNLPPLDVEHFSPGDVPPGLRERIGLPSDARVVLFMGTLFRFAGLEQAIQVFGAHAADDPSVHFVLLGDGEHRIQIEQAALRSGFGERIHLTGRVEYDVLPDYLRLADVAINPFEHSLTTDCALPHKVLQYIATGLPTVSTDLAGLKGVLGDDSGVMFAPRPAAVMEEALRLLGDPTRREVMREQGRRFAEQRLASDIAVGVFEAMLEECVSLTRQR